jgi:hypothetical protein
MGLGDIMSDNKILDEVALNRREITHDVWGSFIIKRPTNKIVSKIDTAVTRAYNRDIQTKERIVDEHEPKGFRDVPAFLTRTAKEKILNDYGEWTSEDRTKVAEAEKEYRKACFELDRAGYTTMSALIEEYDELKGALISILGKNAENLEKELAVLVPIDTPQEAGDYSAPDIKEFMACRDKVEKAAKDLDAVAILDRLSQLHKQYSLIMKGTQAQADLFAIKVKEISLFTDTVESRSEKAGHIVKIFECTLDEKEQKPWKTLMDCEDSDPDMLAWLLGQIEAFERLDSTDTSTEEERNRFNFLFPLGVTSTLLEDSHGQRESKNDGESPQEVQTASIEDLDIPKES